MRDRRHKPGAQCHEGMAIMKKTLTLACLFLLCTAIVTAGCAKKKKRANVQRRVVMGMGDAAHTGVAPVSGVRISSTLLWKTKAQKTRTPYLIADNDAVYYTDHQDKPHAVDRSSGAHKWSFEENFITTSPLIVDDTLFVGTGHSDMYPINRKTGARMGRWHSVLTEHSAAPVTSELTASGDSLYFALGPGYVFSVDIDTAQMNWKFKAGGPVHGSPAVAGQSVFVASSDGRLYALSEENGKVKWTYQARGPLVSSPVVAGGLVLFRNENGNLAAVSAQNGDQAWTFVVNSSTRQPPAVADNTAYFGDEYGNFYAVDVSSGSPKWQQKVGDGIFGAAVIADGVLYFGSKDKYLYALDAATGEIKWKFETSGPVYTAPAVADHFVAVLDGAGMLHAITQGP